MRERAVFIGSISVWDTIGTLRPSGIEMFTLFRPVYCCVMGRKAPRWAPGVSRHDTPNGCRCTRTFLGAPPTPRFGVSEATLQTPGANMRRGNEKIWAV